MSAVNPITFETIKNRLAAAGQEMVATLVRTAGTPIYAEIKDFSCGLFDWQGRQVAYSGLAITHNLAIQNLIQTCIRMHGEDPGICDGDIFMGNDPYLGGGIHAMELGLAAPVFVDGEIVAWSGSIAHQLDIGGMVPGGFCMDAVDCYQEGLRFPPVRLYRKGELQRDIWNIHRNNVRLPDKISMELKGQVAANNVAKRRITELVSKFGVETFRETCQALLDLSSRVTRERIGEIREGVYHHGDVIEVEGVGPGLFPIQCELTVSSGKLSFDFRRDCPPQIPKFINSTRLVVTGMIYSHLMPLLSYDVPWNEGCGYPIEILTTPGTILDAQPPAPCSCPHTSFRAADAALGALNKALVGTSLKERRSACWTSSPPVSLGVAMDPAAPHPIVIPLLEGMSGGGGALGCKDGLDTGASLTIMDYSMGDVETQENAYPILYLTRRYLRDSGGAGRFRGGVGSITAVVPYGAPGVRFFLVEDRRLVPAHGCAGGYPGSSNHWWVARNLDVPAAAALGLGDPEKVLSDLELVPAIGVLDLGPQDAFVMASSGGGGFGDPINREPATVARDVRWGFVSAEKARELYGVAVDPETFLVEEDRTAGIRREMRRQRAALENPGNSLTACSEGEDYVLRRGDGPGSEQVCGCCGAVLSRGNGDWRVGAVSLDLGMAAIGALVPFDERVFLRQHICMHCGGILENEVMLGQLSSD